MEIKNIYILIAVLVCNYSLAQNKSYPAFPKANFYVFGEMHFSQDETSIHQIRLINTLAKRGVRNIKIYMELPPSALFFAEEYFQTGDSTYISNEHIRSNFLSFLSELRKFKEYIKFDFVSIDLEQKNTSQLSKEFVNQILQCIPSNVRNAINIQLLKNKRHLRRKMQKIKDNSLIRNELKKRLNGFSFNLFDQEMHIVSNYGFTPRVRSNKMTKEREEYMARVLDSSYNDTLTHILTIGRDHVIPRKNKKTADLFLNLKKIQRDKIIIMPIIYSFHPYLLYNNLLYPRDKSFDSLVKDGVFDLVVMPVN